MPAAGAGSAHGWDTVMNFETLKIGECDQGWVTGAWIGPV